ncbi:MAG: DUF11 domain-containing protein, partial [Caldilineaceae bacterium]|nr:DUF11 domain-containing protein [Caldilineaceae bacterium]
MYQKSKFVLVNIALTLVALLIFTVVSSTAATPAVFAAGEQISLKSSAPSYVYAGGNITYELVVKNYLSQPITNIVIFDTLPVHTSYGSGGTLNAGQNRVEFTLPSLAANTSHTFTFVVKVTPGTAAGTVIENKDVLISSFTVGTDTYSVSGDGISTTVEEQGTLVAVYKDGNSTPFNVTVDGFKFENFTNSAPRVFSDDLDAQDMFILFGQDACQSGTTAATCVLSGPARKWMENQIAGMNGGHCEGMAVTSLRLFDWSAYKGKYSPADFQSGAATTIDLNFPQQSIENYVASYFVRQGLVEVWTASQKVTPVAAVQKLTTDFQLAKPIAYTIGIYQVPGMKNGHAITAYGVETVNANESRILVYDNNFPKQREYITVNMAANTWRYVTASTPGEPATIYDGTATSNNLELTPVSARDLPAGQYFTCPFCNPEVTSASVLGSATSQITSTIRFDYAGEGAFLVTNDANQSTGYAFDTKIIINEIPGATVNYFKGGLNKDV